MGTIAEKLTYLEGTKSAIKDAIIAKGVEVTDTDTFRSYAEKIESIEAGGSCESQSKEINITDNGTRVVTPDEGYLLDQVTVTTNVTTSKPELPNGISFYDSTWTTFDTDPYDWSQVYSGTNMFFGCNQLQTLTGTGIENSYFLDMYSMFSQCSNLTSLPTLQGKPSTIAYLFSNCSKLNEVDLSKVDFSETVDISNAFQECKEWVQNIDLSNSEVIVATGAYRGSEITQLPNINFSKIQIVRSMFADTQQLRIPVYLDLPYVTEAANLFDYSKITEAHFTGMAYNVYIDNMFYNCTLLTTITGLNCASVDSVSGFARDCWNLTNIDGLFNLGESFTGNRDINFSGCSKLSLESLRNIINTVYDLSNSSYKGTVLIHRAPYSLLTDEDKAAFSAKGWTFKQS